MTASGTRTFAYDALDRLTEVCYQASCPNAGDPFVRWAYDGVGNRTSEQGPAGTTTYSYDDGDRLTQSSGPGGTVGFGYDANGSQTSAGANTFSYDLGGRMRTATIGAATWTYGYDGDGTRMQATDGASTRNYLWDPSFELPQPALERDGSGTLARRYLHGLGPLALTPGASASPSYYTADGLGSVVGVHSSKRRRPVGLRLRALRNGADCEPARPVRAYEPAPLHGPAARRRDRPLPPPRPPVRPGTGALHGHGSGRAGAHGSVRLGVRVREQSGHRAD